MKSQLIHYSPLEKEVVSLFKTNLTQAEIAKKLGIGKHIHDFQSSQCTRCFL